MNEQRGLFEVFKTNEWVEKACPVKSCIDGIIPTDKGVYRCPECKRNTHMTIPVFRGWLPKFSDIEMDKQREERKKVVQDADFRLRRGKEMMNAIVNLWTKQKGRKKERYVSDEEVPF